MVSRVWTAGQFLDTLKQSLDIRFASEGFEHVEVYTGAPGPSEVDDDFEYVAIGISVETFEEAVALKAPALRHEEENVYECYVGAWDLQTAEAETSIKGARDRALEIMAIIETVLREDPKQGMTGIARTGITRKEMDQGVDPDRGGRVCMIEFDITSVVRTDV